MPMLSPDPSVFGELAVTLICVSPALISELPAAKMPLVRAKSSAVALVAIVSLPKFILAWSRASMPAAQA